jgi:predicted  nucleic acid-binding Zn-ribbon protein
MSETKEKQPPLIQLDPRQLKDLIITVDYVTKELKNIADKLVAVESELKLIRMEISELKEKIKK